MAHKNGLQGSLDLTMESMFSPAPAAAPVVSKESSIQEPATFLPLSATVSSGSVLWSEESIVAGYYF